MEAYELMIGNYINYGKFTKCGKIVMFLGTQTLQLDEPPFLGYEEDFLDVDISNINPIPLTEEWLLKFDFFNKGNEILNQYEENTHVFCFGEDNKLKLKFNKEWYGDVKENALFNICFYLSDDFICCLEYVHQLQNLYFALTGNRFWLVEPK
jgi:hypothetical protein